MLWGRSHIRWPDPEPEPGCPGRGPRVSIPFLLLAAVNVGDCICPCFVHVLGISKALAGSHHESHNFGEQCGLLRDGESLAPWHVEFTSNQLRRGTKTAGLGRHDTTAPV